MGEQTAIDRVQEPIASKATEAGPQPPIAKACLTAALRTPLLQDRTNRPIARKCALIGWRVTREAVQLGALS